MLPFSPWPLLTHMGFLLLLLLFYGPCRSKKWKTQRTEILEKLLLFFSHAMPGLNPNVQKQNVHVQWPTCLDPSIACMCL